MRLASTRLVMLPLAEGDFEALHALLTEPGVRRYLCDDVVIPASQTAEYLQTSLELLRGEGAGLWALRLPADPALLGIVGFWYFHEPQLLELLYALSARVWGHGYATEAARRMIHSFAAQP